METAIPAKSKADAQAAIYLLQNDALRMETNTLSQAKAIARLYDVFNAVGAEGWVKAQSILVELSATYGGHSTAPGAK